MTNAILFGRPRHSPNYAAARFEDYLWLRDAQRLTISQAADRLGVHLRTAQRYEARRNGRKGRVGGADPKHQAVDLER